MHNTSGGDDFVCRIASEIEARRGERNREVDGPHPDAVQDAKHLSVAEIQIHAAQLD